MNLVSQSLLKLVRSLEQKKFRQEHQLFVATGKKLVQEALKSGWEIAYVLYSENFPTDEYLPNSYLVKPTDFLKLTDQPNPEGILAVISIPKPKPIDITKGYFFLLENIQDPGNMGTIIRIADWFGFQGVICSAQTVEAFNPKVVRSSMGSLFRVHVHYEMDWIGFLQKHQSCICVADLSGEVLSELKQLRNLILLGNEAHGFSYSAWDINDLQKIHIPGSGLAESLNVAVSAGIIAYHCFTQK